MLLAAVASLAIGLAIWGHFTSRVDSAYLAADPTEAACTYHRIDVVEPSAVAYHPRRRSLFFVSDEGGLAEFKLDLEKIADYPLRGDLEGIAPGRGRDTVFVASEREAAIYRFDLATGKPVQKLRIDVKSHPDFPRGLTFNRGIEGVTVAPDESGRPRLWAVVEAEPARLILLDVDPTAEVPVRQEDTDEDRLPEATVRILRSFDLGVARLSDVNYDAELDALLLPSASSRIVLVADRTGKVLATFRIPGLWPEGFALLPSGDAVIPQDTGGVYICKGMRDEIASALKADSQK